MIPERATRSAHEAHSEPAEASSRRWSVARSQRSRRSVSLAVAVAIGLALVAGPAAARGPGGPAQATIDRWARTQKVLKGATAGVSVRCTADGEVWGGHEADRLLYPASGAKLLTTAAALDLLPVDVSWRTTAHGVVADGRVSGDLVIVGRGDPQLMPDDLKALAERLHDAGVRTVDGDLVVASGCFAGPLLPPAYDMKSADAAYRPSVACAGSNYGAVQVVVRPGRRVGDRVTVRVDPGSDAVVVVNRAKTVGGKGDSGLTVVASDREDGRTTITVAGELGVKSKGATLRKRVADPALLTAEVLSRFLGDRGITVAGEVRVDAKARESDAPELARVESPSLVDALRDLNVWSNNAMAETVFHHLGAGEVGGPATWERAQRAVATALVARGIPATAFVIVNGSGLYEATRVSPDAMTRLLVSFGGNDAKSEAFRASLPVAGESGTLKWRLRAKATRGLVRAKTGTLDGVTSISGYVPAASGCLLAFSIIINDGPDDTRGLRRAADKLILSLARL